VGCKTVDFLVDQLSKTRGPNSLLFVTLWVIWFARRKAIHEEVFQSPLSTHAFVEAFLRDLEHVSASKKKARSPAPFQPVRRWIAPPSPRLLSELTGP
jgi:hypothetical protein